MSDAVPPDESDLAAAVLAGSERAWRVLFDRHAAELHRYALWRCGRDAELAEEAAQESWLTAVKRFRSFRPSRGPFREWLFGVAANVARNAVRASIRQRNLRRPMPDERGVELGESSADAERIAAALASLPERDERVLRMFYFDGLGVREIAAAEGRKAEAVESMLVRARARFREAYPRPEEVRRDPAR